MGISSRPAALPTLPAIAPSYFRSHASVALLHETEADGLAAVAGTRISVIPTKEPYGKRTSHGMILGENGEKMSKSRGNVVNPDDIIDEIGADAFRAYEMFMGAFDQAIPWSTQSAKGCRRFLDHTAHNLSRQGS